MPEISKQTDCEATRCDVCGSPSKVIDSRRKKLSKWRIRECLSCRFQWDTFESKVDPEDLPPKMLQRVSNI